MTPRNGSSFSNASFAISTFISAPPFHLPTQKSRALIKHRTLLFNPKIVFERTLPRASYVVVPDNGEDSAINRSSNPSQPTEGNFLGPDPKFLEDCPTCENSGFVPCSKCDAQGYIRNPRSSNVFYCPNCVGHRKLRCPTCGGKCYMCE